MAGSGSGFSGKVPGSYGADVLYYELAGDDLYLHLSQDDDQPKK